ncbi:MAG TPA: proton-conducting transporter membrane subunit [Limnochordales bacterium]
MQLDIGQIFPSTAMPALILAAGALAVLVVELAAPPGRRAGWVLGLTAAALVLAGLAVAIGGSAVIVDPASSAARLAQDGIGRLAYGIVLVAALVTLVISAPALDPGEPAAFSALLLLVTAGMGLLASATTLPVLFLGLELLSLGLYVMVGYHRREPAAREGAFKYLLLGSVASGLLLFGMALVFAATGELALEGIARGSVMPGAERLWLGGLVLVLVGIAFKLALAPLHLWAPDAYEGAGLGVTAFMSVATKAAAFAALLRVALAAPEQAQRPLWLLAALSMAVGSLGALRQTELRRLMAYSGIANAGYLLIALPHMTRPGIEAALFYLGSYALINLGLFAAVALLQPVPASRYPLHLLEGAVGRDPLAGWALVAFVLALVGMPLTGGFVGKVLLVGTAVREGAQWLAFMLVASTAILAYPYLKLVERAVRRSPETAAPASPAAGRGGRRRLLAVAVVAAAVTLVALGVWPEPLLGLARLAWVSLG